MSAALWDVCAVSLLSNCDCYEVIDSVMLLIDSSLKRTKVVVFVNILVLHVKKFWAI